MVFPCKNRVCAYASWYGRLLPGAAGRGMRLQFQAKLMNMNDLTDKVVEVFREIGFRPFVVEAGDVLCVYPISVGYSVIRASITPGQCITLLGNTGCEVPESKESLVYSLLNEFHQGSQFVMAYLVMGGKENTLSLSCSYCLFQQKFCPETFGVLILQLMSAISQLHQRVLSIRYRGWYAPLVKESENAAAPVENETSSAGRLIREREDIDDLLNRMLADLEDDSDDEPGSEEDDDDAMVD